MNKELDQYGVAAALQEIATLLELRGGKDRFKARAYQAGARVVAGLDEDLGSLIEQNSLTSKPRIGEALASQIKQLYLTGSSSVLNQLRREFPPGVVELSRVPGLSISKIRTLHEALGITSRAELRAAAEAGRLRKVKGFGPKSEDKLLEALTDARPPEERRLHIHHAERIALQLLNYVNLAPGIAQVSVAGSLRRREETVDVIVIVAAARKPAAMLEHFLRLPLIAQVLESEDTSCTVVLTEGAAVRVVAVPPSDYGWTLWRETGSVAHIAKLQQVAVRKRPKVNLTNPATFRARQTSRSVKSGVEDAQIYERLRMEYVPPELREDTGEVEAAIKRSLPQDLITLDNIQGMVHCHTTYSDGKHSIEEMALAAEAMGMSYITITDHSPTAFYAGGVTLDRLQRQWEEIDAVQERVKVKLLKGTESDILANGSLDYPDGVLEKFDVIVASIHSRYKMDSEKMTRRLLTAMRQPVFKIWGHALGRLIQRRPPFECDIEKVLDAIAESRAAIEINGDPYRLDMEPRLLREARKRKIKFVISVDAHSTGALNNVRFGVGIARRGWIRKSDVLNTLKTGAFTKAVRPTR